MSRGLEKRNTPPKNGTKERQAQEIEVLRLIVAGHNHRDVAEMVGISMRTVSNRLDAALARYGPVTVQRYRQVQEQQLDELFRATIGKIQEGNLEAVGYAIRILERKAKLLGLDAPVKNEVEVTQVSEQERELRDLLAAAQQAQQAAEQVIVDGEVVS